MRKIFPLIGSKFFRLIRKGAVFILIASPMFLLFQNCSGFAGNADNGGMISTVNAKTAQYQNGLNKIVDASAGNFGYAYGPSIIFTQGQYHAYFCSVGAGTPTSWDYIRHETSTDMVHWSAPDIILTPTATERSNCDPSVVVFDAGDGPYYYMFYSGNAKNVQTLNFVARSLHPDGPFLKYTDRGTWEVKPPDAHAIIWPFQNSPDNSNVYGAGEPTVVVKNNVLYMWYTDTTNPAVIGSNQYLVTSTNGVNWSPPVLTNVSDVSVDVKFDATGNQFIMIEATPQLSTAAQLLVRTSIDGIAWSAATVVCDSSCFPHYSSNPGLSGDELGHVLDLTNTLVCFGAPYGLNASSEVWGQWDLWGQKINLSSFLPTPPPVANSPALAPTPTPAGTVVGNIDGVTPNGDGTYSLTGWACTLQDVNSIQVALYVGNASATSIGWFPTGSISEPAVATACRSTGSAYRFSVQLSAAFVSQYGGQPIYMYGISSSGLSNNMLNASGAINVPVVASTTKPTITGAGLGCADYSCGWITGANFSTNCMVRLYNANDFNDQITIANPGCQDTSITFKIPPAFQASHSNIYFTVSNLNSGQWNDPAPMNIQTPTPTVTNFGQGCNDGKCVWVQGSNFASPFHVDIYNAGGTKRLYSTASGTTSSSSAVTFRIPQNIYNANNTIMFTVVNEYTGIPLTWSTLQSYQIR